jgi:hypothetical protein
MSPITSVILICASALLPQDCTVDSATDMLEGLEANTPIECLMSSQALIAQSALLRPEVAADHYLKVVCLPSRDFANLRLHQTLDPKDVVDDNSDADDDGELEHRAH